MRISLVVPVFNEQESIALFHKTVHDQPELKAHDIEIVFINDGSTDSTQSIIHSLCQSDNNVSLITFSRNFGKEAALFAGLKHATGDVVIPMDVDLQDPIELVPKMLERYHDGADVVLAKRMDRSSDTAIKRRSAEWFYSIHNRISPQKIEPNVGDFRLMSRQVVDQIIQLPERQLFMKGLLSWVGFDTAVVEYKRLERAAGRSKFNGWRLWNLALEGFTSFSTAPLRIWTYIGAGVALTAFLYALLIIAKKILFGEAVTGYASTMVTILFLGGIQLIGIGVLGEYIGRIYIESKQRPKYIIKSRTINGKKH